MPSVYIAHRTHGAGARPSQAQAPTATMLATPNASQCVHQPGEGRGRNRQTPPLRKKKENKQTAQTKRKWGRRQTNSRKAAHQLHKRRANPPARQHQRRHPTGPPKEHRRTAVPNLATPSRVQQPTGGKDNPETPAHTPVEKWRAEKKTWAQPKRKEKKGRRPREPRPGQAAADTTKPRHDMAENHTPPPQPEKKNKRGGGQTPPTATPADPHATGSPTRRWRETDAAQARGHTPQHPNQKKAECRQNPNPHTHTTNPRRERGSRTKTLVQTHTP